MPTLSEQAMDNQFMEYIMKGDYSAARQMLTQYARIAGLESGGRHMAALLDVLDESHKASFWGYGQSSGSANVVISFV